MDFFVNSYFGGAVLILLGIFFLFLIFRGKRGFTGDNISLFISGIGLCFLGAIVILKLLGYVKI